MASMSGILAYRLSMLSYCWIRAMAVFSPMPGTPGMLSELSPIRAFRSIMWMGAKPYCSWKAVSVISLVVVCPMRVDTSFTMVWSVMSCRLSLSPVTTTQSQPSASHLREMVPIRSSASQPSCS